MASTKQVQTFEGTTLSQIRELYAKWPGAYEELPSGHEHVWPWVFVVDEKFQAPLCHDGVDAYCWVEGRGWVELDCCGQIPEAEGG